MRGGGVGEERWESRRTARDSAPHSVPAHGSCSDDCARSAPFCSRLQKTLADAAQNVGTLKLRPARCV